MKKYFIQTFGCSMNQADSEKIGMMFLQSGFVRAPDLLSANIVIFNTCSVRQKWEDRVFGMLQEIKKHNELNPDKIIYSGVTGCMVRKTGIGKQYLQSTPSALSGSSLIEGAKFSSPSMRGIDWNPEDWSQGEPEIKRDKNQAKKINLLTDKSSIFNYDDGLFPRCDNLDFVFRIEEIKYVPHILTHILWERIGSDDKFDDYLKQTQQRDNPSSVNIIVQTGCDNYCTFCIVPYTRGKEISRPMEDIIEEAKQAVKNWALEINLIWQNVNSYGKQFVDKKLWNEEKSSWNDGIWKSPFRDLLEWLDAIKWLDRIRFTSSNPHDMTQDILDAHFELPSLCNYLHFALQSWNDKMLKQMNRRHSYSDFKKIVDYLRSKDPLFSISTDIIVWYSRESDEMFEDTKKAFIECEFDFSFTARYSVRKWTIASKIYPDDIPDSLKASRWHELNDMLLDSVTKRNTLMLGREEEILISWKKDEYFSWRTRNFKEVFFLADDSITIWDLVKVKITELDRYVLKWKLIK